MFEEEAKEYRKENLCKKCHKHCKEGMCTCSECKIKTFKDGAAFGYKKANEWHYIKDGKYPTHSNRVLVFTNEGVGFGIYGLDNQKWYTYDTGFDVIAWKEIVLPKESL